MKKKTQFKKEIINVTADAIMRSMKLVDIVAIKSTVIYTLLSTNNNAMNMERAVTAVVCIYQFKTVNSQLSLTAAKN